jgi:type II secretory ATPase GspE/PulE/Tfp pilus assembly ATPase PilB-like protein
VLAGESEIARAIDQYYGHELSIDGILHEIETGEIDYRSLAASVDEYSQPVVRLIDALLTDAVKRDASDIHFEPEASFLRIRYRIDGLLRQIRALHKSYWPAMAVRIKVMSGMNIAETRAPQDGRISLNISGRRWTSASRRSRPSTARTSCCASSTAKGIVPLDKLGLDDAQLDLLKLMIARPEGIILVTGPTGSGKTTTLYSVLNHINSEGVNIMTLEDPVEYPMAMIRQTSVAEAAKLDFANGVRSMMRQDPDIILVGEIRDADTAEMAFRAAMTGHQVYSTLHTNSALGVIPRLLDIGVLPDIMAGNIIGVVAQRLVRKLCPHCRKPYRRRTPRDASCSAGRRRPHRIYRAVGCEHCEYQGYRGRSPSWNCCAWTPTSTNWSRAAPPRDIKRMALAKGFRTLAEDGLRRVTRRLHLAGGSRPGGRPHRTHVSAVVRALTIGDGPIRLQGDEHRRDAWCSAASKPPTWSTSKCASSAWSSTSSTAPVKPQRPDEPA